MAKQAIEGASRLNAFLVDPNDLVIVGLDTDDGEEHPHYDPRIKLDVHEPLVRNLMFQGFAFGAVEVTKIGGQLIVIDGRQRVRAAREANKRLAAAGQELIRVRCMVEKGDRADMFGIQVAANAFKQDVDTLSKAELVAKYLAFGRSNKDAARQFGVSPETIRQLLKLLDLSDEVKEAIRSGKISANKALGMVELSEDEQAEALQEAIENDESAGEIKAKAKRKKAEKNGEEVKQWVRPSIRDIREVLEVENLHPSAEHALRWVLGEEDSAQP